VLTQQQQQQQQQKWQLIRKIEIKKLRPYVSLAKKELDEGKIV